jgi:hypothetical protein
MRAPLSLSLVFAIAFSLVLERRLDYCRARVRVRAVAHWRDGRTADEHDGACRVVLWSGVGCAQRDGTTTQGYNLHPVARCA